MALAAVQARSMDARVFRVEDTLRDGTAVTFRAARPDDAPRYVRAFAGLERESVYTRFFGYREALSEADLAHLAALDFVSEGIVVATVLREAEEVIVGSGRYVATRPGCAEVAFVVEEDYRGQGIARRLLGHLAGIARRKGITCFEAYVLPENRPMLAVFSRCGFATTQRREEGVLLVTVALGPSGPAGDGP
jgi:GNAT superfamily N-acetyltransferase